MYKHVVIINGSAGVGKDTFVAICNSFCKVMNYSSINEIKRLAKLIGWDGNKDEKGRKLLSDLKVAMSDYCDLPFQLMKNKYEEFIKSDADILFLHIREPEEIARAASEFNAITLLIKNKNVKQITSNMADANVYDLNYDAVIDNSRTLDDLKNIAKWFIGILEKEVVNK